MSAVESRMIGIKEGLDSAVFMATEAKENVNKSQGIYYSTCQGSDGHM